MIPKQDCDVICCMERPLTAEINIPPLPPAQIQFGENIVVGEVYEECTAALHTLLHQPELV